VILDGENAWEYYPYNGWYFLSGLYQELAKHPNIRVTTFTEYLELFPDSVATLPTLTAGSWVYGDFTTWMGDAAKNRAWDLLCDAKAAYDMRMAQGTLPEEVVRAAELQLRSCESSDWFWWFGDYNPGASVAAFDALYRTKLQQLYDLLGLAVPAALDVPLCQGDGAAAEAGGVMRRGG
jgi:alpha-amylase/alpha-mannosidase (GH57 family)